MIMSKEEQELLDTIRDFVLNRLTTSKFSIDFLAEELGMNRINLYQKIKAITGTTPNLYIRKIRLEIAKDYLENGTYQTVKEVANQIGFQRVDYFSNLYKKEYGKMPSSYFK